MRYLRCDCVIQRIQALARPWCRRRQKYESRPTTMQRTRQREAQDTAWRHAKSRAEDGIAEGEGTRCPCRLSTPKRPSASRMAWRGMYVAHSIVRAMRARMIYVSCVIETIIHNHYGVVSRAVWLAAEITARIDILTCVSYMRERWGVLRAVVRQPCYFLSMQQENGRYASSINCRACEPRERVR